MEDDLEEEISNFNKPMGYRERCIKIEDKINYMDNFYEIFYLIFYFVLNILYPNILLK